MEQNGQTKAIAKSQQSLATVYIYIYISNTFTNQWNLSTRPHTHTDSFCQQEFIKNSNIFLDGSHNAKAKNTYVSNSLNENIEVEKVDSG